MRQSWTQPGDEAGLAWCRKLKLDILSARTAVTRLLTSFQGIAEQANAAVSGMDFRFLFDESRQVFHIGYNASTEQLNSSYYDLLASEARVASLIAIAKGDVPQSHWLHLGRPVTIVNGKQVLLSWSGTMFEGNLMPALFTKNYAGTFLSDSCYTALEAQICYGQEKQVPWGISKSGYFAFDANLNYQYRAFGVPDLGYKRDLPGELVIAPYASLLGLSLQPRAVLENMKSLEQLNMLGRYGFYDALDFTKTRLQTGENHAHRAILHDTPPGYDPVVSLQLSVRGCDGAAVPLRRARSERGTTAPGKDPPKFTPRVSPSR